jgi:hypothetical protein
MIGARILVRPVSKEGLNYNGAGKRVDEGVRTPGRIVDGARRSGWRLDNPGAR